MLSRNLSHDRPMTQGGLKRAPASAAPRGLMGPALSWGLSRYGGREHAGEGLTRSRRVCGHQQFAHLWTCRVCACALGAGDLGWRPAQRQ